MLVDASRVVTEELAVSAVIMTVSGGHVEGDLSLPECAASLSESPVVHKLVEAVSD